MQGKLLAVRLLLLVLARKVILTAQVSTFETLCYADPLYLQAVQCSDTLTEQRRQFHVILEAYELHKVVPELLKTLGTAFILIPYRLLSVRPCLCLINQEFQPVQ